MKGSYLMSIAVLTVAWGVAAAQMPTSPGGQSMVRPPSSHATEILTQAINDMKQSGTTAGVISAYRLGAALEPVSEALDQTYVERMVALGDPMDANDAALRMLSHDPYRGLARGVVAYNEARNNDWLAALGDISQANLDRARDPFIQRTAGSILAWVDYAANRQMIPAEMWPKIAYLRQDVGNSRSFKDAYNAAAQAYQQRGQAADQTALPAVGQYAGATVQGSAPPYYAAAAPVYSDDVSYYDYEPWWPYDYYDWCPSFGFGFPFFFDFDDFHHHHHHGFFDRDDFGRGAFRSHGFGGGLLEARNFGGLNSTAFGGVAATKRLGRTTVTAGVNRGPATNTVRSAGTTSAPLITSRGGSTTGERFAINRSVESAPVVAANRSGAAGGNSRFVERGQGWFQASPSSPKIYDAPVRNTEIAAPRSSGGSLFESSRGSTSFASPSETFHGYSGFSGGSRSSSFSSSGPSGGGSFSSRGSSGGGGGSFHSSSGGGGFSGGHGGGGHR
jgi:hypothetical protein